MFVCTHKGDGMSEKTDAQIEKTNETVMNLQLTITKEFTELKGEQKATNLAVSNLCGKIDGYVTSTEDRFKAVEDNIGHRLPDDANVFSQLQKLQAHRSRIMSHAKALWAFIASLILLGVSQIAGLFKVD
jgi:hypothetical protein